MQARLYAEDPYRNFQPATGLLTDVHFPADLRVDTWVEPGTEVSAHYDPMLAKLIVTADTREQALLKMEAALDATRLAGIETNLGYLRQVLRAPALWLVALNPQGQLFTQVSTDDGRSWSAPRGLDTGSDRIAADGENRPKIAFGPRGQAVIT